jgi:hypothetical protein
LNKIKPQINKNEGVQASSTPAGGGYEGWLSAGGKNRKDALIFRKYDIQLWDLAVKYWRGEINLAELQKLNDEGKLDDCEFRAIVHGFNPFTFDCKCCRDLGLEVCEIDCGAVSCEDCVHLRLCVEGGSTALINYIKCQGDC